MRLHVDTGSGRLTAVEWFARDGRAYVDVDGGGRAVVSDVGVFVETKLWTAESLSALARVCRAGPVADTVTRLTVVDR